MDENKEVLNSDLKRDLESELIETDSIIDKMLLMFKNNKMTLIAVVVLLLIVLCAIFAPLVAPYDPNEIDMYNRLKTPTQDHWLGTDEFGRDTLSRIIYGARISLVIGIVPSLISMLIGTVLGLVSGYFGGKVDFWIMRLADIMLAFPSLLLAMVVMFTLGATLLNIFIALAIVSWAGTARVVRAQTLSLKEKEFVEAARSIGVKSHVIMFKHILPNCLPSLIVIFTLDIPGAILSEASLSFLGIGAQPPSTSWGLMITRGKEYLFSTPVLSIAPGVAILIIVLAFNFLGDGLRDSMDPFMKE